jgi:hypothetical protein
MGKAAGMQSRGDVKLLAGPAVDPQTASDPLRRHRICGSRPGEALKGDPSPWLVNQLFA